MAAREARRPAVLLLTPFCPFSIFSFIRLDDFLTTLIDRDIDELPIMGAFESMALFNPSSVFYPPASKIVDVVEEAFSDSRSLQIYIDMLQDDLPLSNSFRAVVNVTFGENDGFTEDT